MSRSVVRYSVTLVDKTLSVEADTEIEAILTAIDRAGYAGPEAAADAYGMELLDFLELVTAEEKPSLA